MFTNTSSLHELERLMTEIPNFTPRGHGVMILCKHEYTAKNCDCPYHTGREKKLPVAWIAVPASKNAS